MTDYLSLATDAAKVPAGPEKGKSNGHNADLPAQSIEQEAPHYELTKDNRMVLVKPEEVRTGRGGAQTMIPETSVEVANFSARITREVRRLDGESLESVYTVEGNWRWPFVVEVGADEFREERRCRAIIGAVAGHGAIVKSLAHFPLAIQALSDKVERETRYLSTGWQDVNGKLTFVTPAVDMAHCEVSEELRRYCVAPGDTAKGLDALVNGLLEAFDHRQTYFVVAHAFLAPLYRWMSSAKRYLLHVIGETGSLKTAYSCTTMCLYGNFSDEEPTEKWSSTMGKVERLGYEAKDVLFLLDDYKARYVRLPDVVSLIQNYSESRGRGRLNRDASIKRTYWIRGALLSTGEDLPEGEASVISRMLIVRLSRPQGTNEKLRYAQERAAHLPAVMYEYTKWLANANVQAGLALDQDLITWRDAFMAQCPTGATNPGRLATNLAQSKVGFSVMARFLHYMGRWTEAEAEQRVKEFDGYAVGLIAEMAGRIGQEKASNSFLAAIRSLLSSGKAELFPRDSKGQELAPGRELLGWTDGEYVYLLADASYHAAEQWYRQVGGSIGFSRQAIHAQLADDDVLEPGKDKASTVIRVGNRTARVLKLRRTAIEEPETEDELPF